MYDPFLNYFALFLLIFSGVVVFYAFIAIREVPYRIAKARFHPHRDAIRAAGWVSLFTLHALWPFLWIWAMLYRPERGWGFAHGSASESKISSQMDDLLRRVQDLEARAKRAELPAKTERIEPRAKRPELSASTEESAKRGAK